MQHAINMPCLHDTGKGTILIILYMFPCDTDDLANMYINMYMEENMNGQRFKRENMNKYLDGQG